MRRVRIVLAGLALVAGPLAPHAAFAFERQQHAGLGVGPTFLGTGGKDGSTSVGLGLAVHYAYGLTDAFSLVVEGNASLGFPSGSPASVPSGPEQVDGREPRLVAGLGAGVVYVFDVLRWVPYAGLLVGGTYGTGGLLENGFVAPDVQAALGLDYQLSHDVALGVAYRQHFFLTRLDEYPFDGALYARVEWTWGF